MVASVGLLANPGAGQRPDDDRGKLSTGAGPGFRRPAPKKVAASVAHSGARVSAAQDSSVPVSSGISCLTASSASVDRR